MSKSITTDKLEQAAGKLGAKEAIIEAVKPGEVVSDSLKQEQKTKSQRERCFLRTIISVMHSPVKFAHIKKTLGDNVYDDTGE